MISEEALRRAAQEAGQTLTDSLPAPEECQHTFSPRFERKMAKLIRQQHHRSLHQGLRRAACVLVAVLLGGTIFLSTNTKAREVFFGWVCQQMEAGYHYSHQGNAPLPARLVEYQIMVPEGYWLEDSKHTFHSEDYAAEHYVNKAGQYIPPGTRVPTPQPT